MYEYRREVSMIGEFKAELSINESNQFHEFCLERQDFNRLTQIKIECANLETRLDFVTTQEELDVIVNQLTDFSAEYHTLWNAMYFVSKQWYTENVLPKLQ